MVLFVYMQVEWNKYLAWCYNPHKAMFYVHQTTFTKFIWHDSYVRKFVKYHVYKLLNILHAPDN